MATAISFKRPAAAPAAAPAQTPAAAPAAAAPAPAARPAFARPAPAKAAPAAAAAAVIDAPTTDVTQVVPQADVQSALPAVVPSQQLADPSADPYLVPGLGFEGEWDAKDMAMPYLSLFSKNSKGFEEHPDWLGHWIYDKTVDLGTEIRVLFLRATKWYVENLPFGSEQIPQRFSRMQDALAAGFHESGLVDVADLDLLIELPLEAEGAADLSHIIEGDKGYAMARYSVRSTAYGKTARILAKDMGGFLRGNLINGFYTIGTQQINGPKGTYFTPVLKADGKTPDTLKAQIVERCAGV